MSDSYVGFVLALVFIASCHVFATANDAEGLWKKNFDPSAVVRGGFVPGIGESWLCRYIGENGLARVGAYFVKNPGCVIRKDELVIKDENKIQFLTSDGGAHSYAWIRREDVRSYQGAIPTGSLDKNHQTYICRASIFDHSGKRLRVSPGTFYRHIGRCVTPDATQYVRDYDILFDLYSMCDDNVNTENPNEYKKGNWSQTFNEAKAVEAGQEEQPGELSYVCRVREDSRLLLGKHKSSGNSCGYVNGDTVIYGEVENQELLVSTPSNFFGWSPQKNGNIAPGAMHGAYAKYGEPIFICRALAEVGEKVPRSPGSLVQAEGVCVTPINGRVARNPNYEVLVDMRRTCDQHGGNQAGRSLGGHILRTGRLGGYWGVPPTTRPRQQSAPMSAYNSRSEGWASNHSDSTEGMTMGLNLVKLAMDSYASA